MNIELIEELSRKIQDENCRSWNEAKTRTYLIDRMLETLGYIRADDKVWVVEDDADFRSQRGKKVDYSLFNQNKDLALIVEAKKFGVSLRGSTQQLSDYFSNKIKSENRKFIAILSNGVEYQFFCDLDQENILDEKPFFTFNLKDYTPQDIEILKMFSYEKIDGQKIWEWGKIFKTLENQIIKLDTEFVKFIIGDSLPNLRKGDNIVKKYTSEIKKAFKYLIYKTYHNEFIEQKPQSNQKIAKNPHSPIQNTGDNFTAFLKKAILEVLSSQPLTAEQIWEKIQEKYPQEAIHKTSNPVKRVSEVALYDLENVQSVGKNPSRFFLKTTSWTEQEVLERFNTHIKEMYQDIKTEIQELENASINFSKAYISFKTNNKNFVGFIFQQSKIRVFFTPNITEFHDPNNKLIDTKGKNTGNGNTEFYYEDPKDKDYLLSLIKQSYDKLKA